MFCMNCGNKIEDTAVFCSYCGIKVKREEELSTIEISEKIEVKSNNQTDDFISTSQNKGSKMSKVVWFIVFVAVVMVLKYFISGFINQNNTDADYKVKNDSTKLPVVNISGDIEKLNTGEKIYSSNHDVSILVPNQWDEDDSLNEDAILGASYGADEKYIIILSEPKDYFSEDMTLYEYYDLVGEMSELESKNISQPEHVSINGSKAILFEQKGEANNIKVHFLCAVIEDDNTFYRIYLWTLKSYFEEYKDEYKKIIGSFMFNSPEMVVDKDSSNLIYDNNDFIGQPILSNDGTLSINIPAEWYESKEFDPEKVLQAESQHGYIGIVSEGKEDFTDDMTLEHYADLILTEVIELELKGISEPTYMTIDGYRAMSYKVRAEYDKVLLSGYLTYIEGDDEFYQVVYMVVGNSVENYTEEYISIINTFKVIN